ncbi:phage distal tail protein [Streptosporangium sp. G12]
MVTPSINVSLGAFSTSWDFPALAPQVGVTLPLGVFSTEWAFPAFTPTVPSQPGDQINDVGQVEWNGVLWGTGTNVRVRQIDGWTGLPGIDNLNVERPSRHGAWPGRRLAQQRLVTIRLQIQSAGDPTQVDSLLRDLDAVTGLLEDETEWPLVIRGYGEPLLAYGAIVDRDTSMDGDYSVGLPSVSVLIACSDPRKYGLELQSVVVPDGGGVSVSNSGNAATHPLIRIPGPAPHPILTNHTLGRVIEFDLTVGADELLEIDPDAGTVTVDGVNRMSSLTGTSVPVQDWVLGSGTSDIAFETSSGLSLANVLWRHAHL